jgi:ATP-dependent DNA helicase RecQ
VQQASDKFNVLSLRPEGLAALKQRKTVMLTKPVTAPETKAQRVGEIACDEALFERLRQLRKQLADERGVPPYIVFSDVSLRQMARDYPTNEREFTRISGVGQKKLEEFGQVFLAEIAAHAQQNPRQIFAESSFATAASTAVRARLTDTVRETLRRLRTGDSVETIAAARSLSTGTIYGHLTEALLAGEEIDLGRFLTDEAQRDIAMMFLKLGSASLGPVFEALGARYDYDRLRLVRAALMRRHQ